MNGNITAIGSIEAQITLIFVVIIFAGLVIFLALLGRLTSSKSDYEPYEREQTPEEQKQLFVEAKETVLGNEVTEAWNCKNCGGPNNHQFCQYCGRAKE